MLDERLKRTGDKHMHALNSDKLSLAQFAAALRLAAAHGHDWATWCVAQQGEDAETAADPRLTAARAAVAAEMAACAVSIGAIRDTSQSCPWEGHIGGIQAPDVDEFGVVHHTTGTGRTAWTVRPDGRVKVTVARHDGRHAVVCHVDGVGGRAHVEIAEHVAFARHVHAAATCLRALGVGEAEIRALYERVEDGPAALAEADAYAVEKASADAFYRAAAAGARDYAAPSAAARAAEDAAAAALSALDAYRAARDADLA